MAIYRGTMTAKMKSELIGQKLKTNATELLLFNFRRVFTLNLVRTVPYFFKPNLQWLKYISLSTQKSIHSLI
jgi:hypothetical protein